MELYRANIGDLFLSHARIDGGIYAAGMKVARNVRIQGSRIRSRADLGWRDEAEFSGAVTLAGSEIGGSIYVSTESTRGALKLMGQVQLSSVSCRQIFMHPEVFREAPIGLDGLTYTRFRGTPPRELLRELMASPDLQRQAFVQLAAYCQSVGDINTRRCVLVGLEKRITTALPRLSPTRIIRVLHQALVGYGYRSARALPWLLLCVLCAALLVHWRGTFLVLKSTLDPGTQGVFESAQSLSASVAITLDSFLPFAALGVKDGYAIVASSSAEWAWLSLFLALKFGAWGLAALALASITGVIRQTS